MNYSLDILDWDTEFFGCKIGKLIEPYMMKWTLILLFLNNRQQMKSMK